MVTTTQLYIATAVNLSELTSYLAKKLSLEEDGLEVNLLTGELSYIDNFNAVKEIITILKPFQD